VIQITPTQVLSRGLRLFTQLGFGKDENDKVITEILDATPLTNFLKSKLDMKQLYRNLRNKVFYAIGLALTNYATGSNVTVFDGDEEILEWSRSYRLGLRTRLKLRHVLASSAIPFLFPPVKVNNNYFGDGAIRMTAPLSSAIHLGARKLLAVGVRYYRTPEETKVLNMTLKKDKINFSDIAGVMLNALFMDSLDSDVERLETLNRILESHQNFQENYIRKHEVIPVLVIRPSVDLASFAQDLINDLKWIYKHMLKALGTQGEHGSDLLSYLAFDSKYTTRLIELGRIDALAKRDEFLRWLEI
jgi:NTE family protein